MSQTHNFSLLLWLFPVNQQGVELVILATTFSFIGFLADGAQAFELIWTQIFICF